MNSLTTLHTASNTKVLNIIKQSEHFSKDLVQAAKIVALNRQLVNEKELPILMRYEQYQRFIDSLWNTERSQQEVIQILHQEGVPERLATQWIVNYQNSKNRAKRYHQEDTNIWNYLFSFVIFFKLLVYVFYCFR